MNDELETIKNNLWAVAPGTRLKAADDLHKTDGGNAYLKEKQKELKASLPAGTYKGTPWPYGYTTPINPAVLTMGIAPASREIYEKCKDNFGPPTVGEPHSHYIDHRVGDKKFWDPMVDLAETILMPEKIAKDDVPSIFGNVNLSTEPTEDENGNDDKEPKINDEYVMWLLETIRDHLCPNVLVLVGVKKLFENKKYNVADCFKEAFPGFEITRAKLRDMPNSENFQWYESDVNTSYKFQEWDVNNDKHEMKIVAWPNAPRRVSTTYPKNWRDSCRQFVNQKRKRPLFPKGAKNAYERRTPSGANNSA